jgi:hypothetical protein
MVQVSRWWGSPGHVVKIEGFDCDGELRIMACVPFLYPRASLAINGKLKKLY